MQQIEAPTNIRQPYLSGKQSVAGIWLPSEWFNSDERAKRILASWRTGAVAIRFAQGDVLRFSAATAVDCETLLGWPLQQFGSSLSSAQLKDEELAQLPSADYWIVTDARVSSLHDRDGARIDVAAWLNVAHLTLHDTYDCSQVLPSPTVLQLESRPVREVLGDVPPASREQAEFLQALQKAQQMRTQGESRPSRARLSMDLASFRSTLIVIAIAAVVLALILASSSGTPIDRLLGFFVAVGGSLFAIFRIAPARDAGSPSAQPQRAAPNAIANRAQNVRPQKWRAWIARAAMMTRLARLVGLAQARHMRRLMGYFDSGNLSEALRHAIPVDGKTGSLGQGFGVPGRRNLLTVSQTLSPTIDIGFGEDVQAMLRQLYRQAFAKLDREQRIDEAVFVLAELLNSKTEALDYLEKHERFTQAAELALGWDMPADVIVRLQCLAGDWRRAIAVARRDNAFANVVLQLEKRWPQAAQRLRKEWGRTLSEQGNWLQAVEAVWPVEALRKQAAEWLTMAERSGGALGARALVQRAHLLPDTIELYVDYLKQVQSDPARWLDRRNLAMALLQMKREQVSRHLVALVAPGVLVDQAAGHRHFDRQALRQLINLSQDLLLQHDMPSSDWPVAKTISLEKAAEPLVLSAPAAGLHGVMDAVPLDDQRYLIALGEAGAIVVDVSGAVIVRFAIPADSIVLSHTNQVALVLARRETLWRVSRLDLAQRAIVDLGLCELDAFAREFDGVNWTIYRRKRIQVLDVTRSLSEVVWQIADLPGRVYAISATAQLEQLFIRAEAEEIHLFMYRLPERRLISRDSLPELSNELLLPKSTGGVWVIQLESHSDKSTSLKWKIGSKTLAYEPGDLIADRLQFLGADEWLLTSSVKEQSCHIDWVSITTGKKCASVCWPTSFFVRHHASKCMVFDREGRLLILDYATGRSDSIAIR